MGETTVGLMSAATGQLFRLWLRSFERDLSLPKPSRFRWVKVTDQVGVNVFEVSLGMAKVPDDAHDNDVVKTRVLGDWTEADGTPGHAEVELDVPAEAFTKDDWGVAKLVTPAGSVVFSQLYMDKSGNEGKLMTAPAFEVTDVIGPNAPTGFTSVAVTDQV